MGQLFSLGAHTVDQFGVSMAQHHRHHARTHVVVGVVVHVDQFNAFAAVEHNPRLMAPAQDVCGITIH